MSLWIQKELLERISNDKKFILLLLSTKKATRPAVNVTIVHFHHENVQSILTVTIIRYMLRYETVTKILTTVHRRVTSNGHEPSSGRYRIRLSYSRVSLSWLFFAYLRTFRPPFSGYTKKSQAAVLFCLFGCHLSCYSASKR